MKTLKYKNLGIFTVKKIVCNDGKYYTYGGFGMFVKEISKYHNKVKLFAHVRHSSIPKGHYELDIDKLEIVHLPFGSNELAKLLYLPITFLKSLLNFKDIDVIQARVPDTTGLIGVVLANIFRKPLYVLVIADWKAESQKYDKKRKFGLGLLVSIYMRIYDYFEFHLVKNKFLFLQGGEIYKKYSKSKDKVLFFSSAHSINDIQNNKNCASDKLKLLTVGRLVEVKSIETIILAIKALINSDIDVDLNIVGDGPDYKKLKHLTESLSIESNVHFLGQLDRNEDFWKLYDDSNFFILASKSEGTPKVLLEAFARSLPVIASNVGGVSSMLDNGDRGFLYEYGDFNAIAEVVRNATEDEINIKIKKASEFAKLTSLERSTEKLVLDFDTKN